MLQMNAGTLRNAAKQAGPIGPLPEGWYESVVVEVEDKRASTGAQMLELVVLHKVPGFERKVRRYYRLVYRNADGLGNPVAAKTTIQLAEATDAILGNGEVDESLMVSSRDNVRPFHAYIGIEAGSDGFDPKNVLWECASEAPPADGDEDGRPDPDDDGYEGP